jgi:hypothetical protein
MTTTTTTTFTLTTYGVEETFRTVNDAKQWVQTYNKALKWERYEDGNGESWAGYTTNVNGDDLLIVTIR